METLHIVYLLMVIVPTILLGIMLFLGFDSGADIDADIGGDFDLDLDTDLDVGGFGDGPGIFSLRLIMAFIIGYGLGGFLSLAYNWVIPHWLCGLLGGALIYYLVYLLLKLLYSQQSSSQVSHLSLEGRKASVSIAIKSGKVGEIKVSDLRTGLISYMIARSYLEGEEFVKNEVVIIKSITGDIARVISAEIDLN
ncbi:MAG: hypothetical protein KAH30_06815 [Caldisericia bacterium]|nr:hypothetical protein [Caldisericia bacterium]